MNISNNNSLKLIAFMIMLLLLTGCNSPKSFIQLKTSTEGISQTMVNFFELDGPTFKGSVFQAKILDIVAVPFQSGETTVHFYRFRLLIAPIENRPVTIESMYVQPSDSIIKAYLQNNRSNSGFGNLDEWNSLTKKLKGFRFDETPDFTAYKLEITLNDLGDESLDQESIENEVFIEALRNIELVIKYNQKTEKLVITSDLIDLINSSEDPMLSERSDLVDLLEDGQTKNSLVPYR